MTEKRLRPRKAPRQQRAVETRDRILDAARTVFATHGYAAGTTNRIAEGAGLSVGSLYQYFPNKDAILVELARAHIDEGTREVLAAARLVAAPGADGNGNADDVEAMVRRVVTAMVGVHARDRRLHQVLFEESPRPPTLLAELRRLEDTVVALVAARLATTYPGLRDAELVARITVTTIESLVHRLVANDRPLDTDRFVDETTRLVVGYLAGAATGAGPGRTLVSGAR
jgi:AcrR family transcriptional regulator